MMLDVRESELLALLRREGPLSRWELHQRTGLRANTVGELAAGLIDQGMLREGQAAANGRGRPRVPLEIDPQRRQVLGIALQPGRVEHQRLNLHGEPAIDPPATNAPSPDTTASLIDQAVDIVEHVDPRQIAAVGVGVPGFIDLDEHTLLLSSITPDRQPVSLQPLYDAVAGVGVPLVIENDMHALAAQWSLTHQADVQDDILLVSIRDGAVGAAVLVEGRPNRGCVGGGNELGHHRFFVDTQMCYCGHRGCLERIFSTAFLNREGDGAATELPEAAARFDGTDPRMVQITDYLAAGLANAVNFIRPNRLVIASPLKTSSAFDEALVGRTRDRLLGALVDRVCIDRWDQPAAAFAEAAGWLALTSIYRTGWGTVRST